MIIKKSFQINFSSVWKNNSLNFDGDKKKEYNGYNQTKFNATGRLILNRSLEWKHKVDDVIKFYPTKKDFH